MASIYEPDAATSPVKHSRFGASSAHRWLACPASVQACAGRPQKESPYAAEGTLLHDVAAKAVQRFFQGGDAPLEAPQSLTTEQIGVVRKYLDTIREDAGWGEHETMAWVENGVSLPDLHPEFFGTADCIVVDDTARVLRCYDLKCGAGVPVEVEYDGRINPQLGYYLLGAFQHVGGRVWADDFALPDWWQGDYSVEIVVVQPRSGGVKRRTVALTELMDLAARLASAARLADSGGELFRAGSHCRFCLAKADCRAFREHAKALAKADFREQGTSTLSDDDLADVLDQADLIEAWIAAVREEAVSRMEAGVSIRGRSLVKGRPGNRYWLDADLAAARLVEQGFDRDMIQPRKLVTPAEVERIAKVHMGFEVDLSDLTDRPPGKSKLNKVSARDDFGED